MSENKITMKDVEAYEKFFSLIPSFLLERYAKKNTNLVLKFKSKVESYMAKMSDGQKLKLDILLNSDVDELQGLMNDAYQDTNKKQYKILANPKYKPFIETNIEELRQIVEK